MVNETQLVEVIKKAKESDKTRKFQQSIELILVFKDIDVKKGFAIKKKEDTHRMAESNKAFAHYRW